MIKAGSVSTPWRQERLWALSDDRRTVWLQLPPSTEDKFGTLPVFLAFDAKAVDEVLDRLISMRARMLPPPCGDY